jgi:hypothetical protein
MKNPVFPSPENVCLPWSPIYTYFSSFLTRPRCTTAGDADFCPLAVELTTAALAFLVDSTPLSRQAVQAVPGMIMALAGVITPENTAQVPYLAFFIKICVCRSMRNTHCYMLRADEHRLL